MIDVHDPHETVHTWKDFFIHIATIIVGLVIAIGLEQSVEAIHHYHQREYLEKQMHDESESNLDLVKAQILFATESRQYLADCLRALQSAPLSSGYRTVTLPPDHISLPNNSNGLLISPSNGTWTVAKAAGTIALLPPETAKIYARLALEDDFEQAAESATASSHNLLASARLRDHVPPDGASPLHLTSAQFDDLVFSYSQAYEVAEDFQFRLVVLEGALEAVLANIRTLEEMYPYQERCIARDDANAAD